MYIMPFYENNKEWYTVDENGKARLTDKAPKRARDSFIAWHGSDDPRKRSIFYFLHNPAWYTVDLDFYKKKYKEGAFELTKKAPPEAVWSRRQYYAHDGIDPNSGKWYFMTNRLWYTKTKGGDYVLTDKAIPAAKGSFLEYKKGCGWINRGIKM